MVPEPWGAFQYQKISLPKISLPKMSFGLVQSGWGESECFNKNLAPGSSEVFKDIFRAYRNAPQYDRSVVPEPCMTGVCGPRALYDSSVWSQSPV